MLSQQIRNSGSLLGSIDAIRNWRAVLVLLATLAAAAIVFALAALLAGVSVLLLVLFVLLAYGVLFYGANASGMMLMDEAKGLPSRPPMEAVMMSLATSHRLILAFLLLGLLYLAGFVVLAIVLVICKLPFIGPALYALVFPVSVVVFGIAMFALPTVVFPLSAPAIWNGASTMECVSQLLAIARKRLLLVVMLMIAVAFIAGVVALLIAAILVSGMAVTTLLSLPILGPSALGGFGGFMAMLGGEGIAAGMAGVPGHAIGGAIGGGMLFAIAFTLPGLVYLRGACMVYLRAIEGLDLAAEQAAIDARLAAAAARAREMQAKARGPAATDAAATAAAAEPERREPVLVEAAFDPVRQPVIDPTNPELGSVCPKCGAAIGATDSFCARCGHRLQAAPPT